MTAHLYSQRYGKSRVRLSRITRNGPRHEFIELTAAISLDGDFAAAFTAADNHLIVATDTMKNTVYALANEHGVPSIEAFGLRLAAHFLETYAHVSQVTVSLEERPWTRINLDGEEEAHSFVASAGEEYCCEIAANRQATTMRSGLRGLRVLKTTGSGFSGFLRDRLTTLPETDDRIFATAIEASWPCANLCTDWLAIRQSIRAEFLRVFAREFSPSVQATLFQMAEAVFARCVEIDEISITMPNQHHLPANLTPLGLKNANVTFIPTDEPHGLISAVVRRGSQEAS
ncbi:Uricase [Anatilimnocola aggregata]|uniref:Uricase n=1 Tax=Anatilimnocola aggregata TaxID=2528021 RepID=A0A517YDH1_9BACT|nr:urate oxidase [Anatilimnocola aggregata]QDU28280.1 Uricase [Anatilimnocola aggregata]